MSDPNNPWPPEPGAPDNASQQPNEEFGQTPPQAANDGSLLNYPMPERQHPLPPWTPMSTLPPPHSPGIIVPRNATTTLPPAGPSEKAPPWGDREPPWWTYGGPAPEGAIIGPQPTSIHEIKI